VSVAAGSKLGVYEVIARIGSGGMGEVYRARDTRLKRDVAVKVLPEEMVRNPDHVSRFNREAEMLASVNHPNLASIYSVGDYEGQPFLVMELLEGETLRTRIENRRLFVSEIVEIAVQVADGLEAAHSRGVVHRDIKPANIFVTASGQVKVLDFGIAKLIASGAANTEEPTLGDDNTLTTPGTMMGTVSYMSPEQVRGENLDARTDLFSLGLVFYEMAAGRQAFTGNTSAIICEAILNRRPAPLTEHNQSAPSELQQIVNKLIEKDRSRRYQTAAELRSDLQRLKRNLESGLVARPATAAAAEKKSIVVVPFVDISATRDNEYFADGLTDEIITDLSQLRMLRVISRNSSMQLKGSGRVLKSIAHDLNVQYVLEGTVRKAGDSLRVTAQLIDATNDENLWAEKYSGKLEDVFDIQETISRKIVDALKMKLSPGEDRRLSERPVADVHAYDCYHRAFHEIYKFTPEGLDHALSLLKNALNIVGDNELLYGALGTVYWQYINAAFTSDMSYLDKTEECAEKAFALNRDSAAGHLLVGLVAHKRGNLPEAIRSLKRALAIEPNNLFVLGELQRIYMSSGQEIRARSMVDHFMTVDPLSPISYTARFAIYLFSGQAESCETATFQCLRVSPEVAMLRTVCALYLIYRQRFDEARALLDAAPEEKTPTISGQQNTFLKHALAGRRAEAAASFTEDMKLAAKCVEYWSWVMADCYALIDETDQALGWLENAVRKAFIHYPFLSRHDTALNNLHGHPRFEKLMQEVKYAWEHLEGA
jgi:serine/threonine protein kinase/Tfp pilus assembly protein PilF